MTRHEVLSTKEIDSLLAEESERQGVTIRVKEMIAVEGITDEKTRQAVNSVSHCIVVFTSRNAVRNVAVMLSSTDQARSWKIYCTGGATRETIVQLLERNADNAAGHDARRVAEELIANEKPQDVVFFCGNRRRDELPHILQEAGFEVKDIVVYQTMPKPERVEQEFGGVLFFSPSAVTSFFQANKIPEKTICFSVGETTTATIRQYTSNRILTATQPSEKSVVELVKQTLGEQQSDKTF